MTAAARCSVVRTKRIAKRGRGRGIGFLAVTLRSAALSKNVLNQSDRIIAMRTTAPLDLKAVDEWVKYHRAEGFEDVIPSLPGLATGEAWVSSPERGVLARVKVLKARSLDTSATPEVGGKEPATAKLKKIDLDLLGEQMAATVERAKENDPAALKKRIHELERQVAAGVAATQAEPEIVEVEKIVEVPVSIAAELKELEAVANRISGDATDLKTAVELMDAATLRLVTSLTPRAEPSPRRQPAVQAPAPVQAAAPPAPRPSGNVDGTLPLAAARLLTVLGQFPDGRTPKQLAVLSGYKVGGSSYRGGMAELRKRGYVSPANVEPIVATPEGLAVAPAEPLPTGRELYDHWRRQLPEAARRVLDLLYERWPDGYAKDELAIAAGYEPGGSSFRGAMAALRNVDLATPAGVEPIKASDELMDES